MEKFWNLQLDLPLSPSSTPYRRPQNPPCRIDIVEPTINLRLHHQKTTFKKLPNHKTNILIWSESQRRSQWEWNMSLQGIRDIQIHIAIGLSEPNSPC